jgi:hypothetical protein
MLQRKRDFQYLLAAAVSLLGAAAAILAAQGTGLPHPPGSRVATLPRQPEDKPAESSVAVDPRDPKHAIVSYHQAIGEGSDHHPNTRNDGHIAVTTDAGKTWTIAPETTDPRYKKWFDAAVAFDLHGHAFVAYLAMDQVTMTAREGEFVRRSLDGGRTWEKPVDLIALPANHPPKLEHFPNIVPDNNPSSPHVGTIYEVWDRILDIGESEELAMVKSTDDGKSWSQPRTISKHPAAVAHSLTIGSDGTLYMMVAYLRAKSAEIVLETSRDAGETWSEPTPVVKTGCKAELVDNFPRQGGWPLMAMDPRGGGRLFVVWNDCPNGHRDIFMNTSADGGRTWSPTVRVNNDSPSVQRDHAMEWITVDPTDGSLYVIFYDRRGDPNNALATVTLARSSDGGRTFKNYSWSDTQSDPKQATLGDYIGIGAYGGLVYGAWPENARAPGEAPKVYTGKFKLDVREENDADWPFGPTAMHIGFADFRNVGSNKAASGR